mmetsp:Transcript_46888/g.93345  ORF Transcript_46888/g.93345 Transcript_46888/m.93345 type:complete len:365 (+) Transcript_46888:61-1155(+)
MWQVPESNKEPTRVPSGVASVLVSSHSCSYALPSLGVLPRAINTSLSSPRQLTHSVKLLEPLPSPLVQYRSVLPVQRRKSEPESPFCDRKTTSHESGKVFNAEQSKHLKALITNELQVCRQALIADQHEMRKLIATLEAKLEAEIHERSGLVKQAGDIEAQLHRLDGGFSKAYLHLESRVDSLASQQISQNAENRQSKHETLAYFELHSESLKALERDWRSLEARLASILPVNESLAATDHNGSAAYNPKGRGGQESDVCEPLLIAAPATAERCMPQSAKYRGINPGGPAHEEIQARTDTTPSPGMPPEKSMRVKALEMALASMQQQEQEQIRGLQQRICQLETVPIQSKQRAVSLLGFASRGS